MKAHQIQQINLYQPVFRRGIVAFSAKAMLTSTFLLCAGLALLYGVEFYNLSTLNDQLSTLGKIQADKLIALEKLDKALPLLKVDPSLEEKIATLYRQKEALEYMTNELSTKAFGNRTGFSPFLAALAREPLHGLWLNQIELSAGGAQIGMQGQAYQSESVPGLLQRLEKEPVFEGSGFQVFHLARNEKNPTQMDFSFRSTSDNNETGKAP